MTSDAECSPNGQKTESAAGRGGDWAKAFPGILWVLFAAVAFWLLYSPIEDLARAVAARVKAGAAAEFGPVKLEAIKISRESLSAPSLEITSARHPELESERREIYRKNHNLFVAHRLFPSRDEGQTYDIWIYLVPHKTSLDDVRSARYYLGPAWGENAFTSTDRGKSFGIVVSAYGPVLALIEIELNSGEKISTWAYIDFEGGFLGNRGGV